MSATEASRRAIQPAPLPRGRCREPLWKMLFEAAMEPFVVLLAVAGGLAILVGEVRDGVLVLLGLLPIVGADVITEYRGERVLEALRAASAPWRESVAMAPRPPSPRPSSCRATSLFSRPAMSCRRTYASSARTASWWIGASSPGSRSPRRHGSTQTRTVPPLRTGGRWPIWGPAWLVAAARASSSRSVERRSSVRSPVD